MGSNSRLNRQKKEQQTKISRKQKGKQKIQKIAYIYTYIYMTKPKKNFLLFSVLMHNYLFDHFFAPQFPQNAFTAIGVFLDWQRQGISIFIFRLH